MGEDELEIDLSLIFNGIEGAKEYLSVLKQIDAAQKSVKRSAGAIAAQSEASSQIARVERSVSAAGASAAPRVPVDKMGTAATKAGISLDKIPPGAKKVLDTILALGGGFGRVVKGMIEAYVTMAAVTGAVASASNHYTESRATSGGSMADVARLGLMGGNASAARAFQERITSNPEAMSAAGRIGIHNLKGPYGNLNWSAQYLKAIEQTSKIADESLRQRLALMLGIEQEVAKYSLLSPATRDAMMNAARTSEYFNDSATQRRSQEALAALKMQKQAIENLGFSLMSVFGEDAVGLIQEVTKSVNETATTIKAARQRIREALGDDGKRYDTFMGAMTHGKLGDAGYRPGEEAGTDLWYARADMHKKFKTQMGMWTGGRVPGDPGVETNEDLWPNHLKAFRTRRQQEAQGLRESPIMSNTMALQVNTEAMNRLSGIIGGGRRTREALPDNLRGQFLHQAMMTGQLRLGALG